MFTLLRQRVVGSRVRDDSGRLDVNLRIHSRANLLMQDITRKRTINVDFAVVVVIA